MSRAVGTAALAALLSAAALAQGRSYGKEYTYDFDERGPRTRVEKVIAEKLPSVVKVHGASGLATIDAYATGVIVSEEGHVLTLDLIMIQKGQTRVVLHDGSVHEADVMPADPKLRVRMLKIKAPGKKFTPIVPTARTDWRHGTFTVSIGNCFRLAEFSEKLSATFGVLTARVKTGLRYRLSDVDYEGELLVTDAPNNPGHYGGGLFTLGGQWIGLNTRILESTETNTQISAAIPAWDLQRYIEASLAGRAGLPEPVAEEAAARPEAYHGIVLFDRGLRRSPPAYVERVKRGSPGREIGLRADDLIVRLDDHSVRSCKEFRRIMGKFEPGQTVQVTFKRGSKVLRKPMKLEAKP